MRERFSPGVGPDRYRRVSRDEEAARSLVARSVPAEFDPSDRLPGLWEVHGDAMERFRARAAEHPSPDEVEDAEESLLDLKVAIGKRLLEGCRLCEHGCGVDRTDGRTGVCGVGEGPLVASEFLHVGEEPELVPSHTVFFGGCTLRCVFCQNHDISGLDASFDSPSPQELAAAVDRKRRNDARNVNWVGGDPTPHLPYVLETLRELELNTASVWNSNMYLSPAAMRLLDGTQDLYLADLKYGSDECGFLLSKAHGYLRAVHRNLAEAADRSDLLVRHLVMPNHLDCCTGPALDWVAEELGPDTRVNLMFQYRPAHRAASHPSISRPLNREERESALRLAEEAGLTNLVEQ